jgi:hypothetical protein
MEYAFTRNIMVAAVAVAMAIGGVLVAFADDRSKGPVDPNQGVKGKADMGAPTTMPADGPILEPAKEFHRAFKSAATATERRGLVMKACDSGVIHSRMGLDDLKKLFGDSPMFIVYPVDKETGKQSALLYFSPPQPPPSGPVTAMPDQTAERPWYMWFFLEHDDLRLYYLTNYGK